MPPMYEYSCDPCNLIFEEFKKLEDYNVPGNCPECAGEGRKVFITPPNVRTDKLSRTFLDGTKRKGYEDEKKAAQVMVDRQNMHHDSEDYAAATNEMTQRRRVKK